ncbi:MAG: DUF4304 domain-containing protein [Aestuariibaculum sp.]
MIKDKFKEIVKLGIHPPLKDAGFKKSGNHFIKKLDETQQVVTLQLSQGNSREQLRFYFRCGILINNMKSEPRDLKSEVYADYRFSINRVTNEFDNDQFDITKDSQTEPITLKLEEVIKSELIPFFNSHQTEKECIDFMTSQDSLQSSFDLIKYLCTNNQISQLEEYVVRLTKFLKSIKDQYNDPNTARKRVDKMISLISDLDKLTPNIEERIEKSW